jgi:lysine 2,3-aminomutase
MYNARDRRSPVLGRSELLRRFPELPARLVEKADALFPVRVTRSWAARMTARGDDPLAAQVLPDPAELQPSAGDVADPVGEAGRRPAPYVVQKHADRVLLQVTRRCHLYCRYCFRRDQHDTPEPSSADLDRAIAFARDSGAHEAILSGGDPLTLSDRRLFGVIDALRPSIPVIRVHSRAPITAPYRVTDALVDGLSRRRPVWLVVHCNHPDELSSDVRDGLERLRAAGVPLLNQSVLLRGVNDDPDVLARLSDALVELQVFPYYLHHTDPVPGNARFRVAVDEGLRIHAELGRRVSGIGLPRYVIDPPDGSGKVDVARWAARKA